jgi:hypothetical protein
LDVQVAAELAQLVLPIHLALLVLIQAKLAELVSLLLLLGHLSIAPVVAAEVVGFYQVALVVTAAEALAAQMRMVLLVLLIQVAAEVQQVEVQVLPKQVATVVLVL